jgi:hypothetical protein
MNPPIHMPTTVIGYIRASTPQASVRRTSMPAEEGSTA